MGIKIFRFSVATVWNLPLFAGILLALPGFQVLSAQTVYESLRAGDYAYNRSNYSKAEPHYRKALTSDPGNWNAAYNLGNALYEQGKYEDAAKIYEQAIAHAPDAQAKADVLHNAGNAWLKQNKFKEAIKDYENSLRLRPGDPETKMNLQMAKKKNKEEEQRKQQQQEQQNKEQQQNKDQQEQNPDQDKQDQNQQQNQPQDQPQNQQNKNQQQEQQKQSQQPNKTEQQQQQENDQQMKQEAAKRLLETTIGPEDKKNAQKYRSIQQKKVPAAGKKDW